MQGDDSFDLTISRISEWVVSNPIGCSEASVAYNITDETANPPTFTTFYRCNAALNLDSLNCSIPDCDMDVTTRFDLTTSNATISRNARGKRAGDNAILRCREKGTSTACPRNQGH